MPKSKYASLFSLRCVEALRFKTKEWLDWVLLAALGDHFMLFVYEMDNKYLNINLSLAQKKKEAYVRNDFLFRPNYTLVNSAFSEIYTIQYKLIIYLLFCQLR